jgi:hypothetical protein
MALLDAMFEFSDAQALTASAAATNVIDMQNSDLEMGAGNPMYLNVRVGDTALTSSGNAATLDISLVGDTDATIDGSSIVVTSTKQWTEAECVAGAWLMRQALPVDFDADQYIGIYYTVGTENFTAGNINAWIDNGNQSSYDTQVAESNI